MVFVYNRSFPFWSLQVSYYYFQLFNHSTIYTRDDAYYEGYEFSFSLTELLFIENIGLNNIILLLTIISINIVLVTDLRRLSYQRRHHVSTNRTSDWKEQCYRLHSIVKYSFYYFSFINWSIVRLGNSEW